MNNLKAVPFANSKARHRFNSITGISPRVKAPKRRVAAAASYSDCRAGDAEQVELGVDQAGTYGTPEVNSVAKQFALFTVRFLFQEKPPSSGN